MRMAGGLTYRLNVHRRQADEAYYTSSPRSVPPFGQGRLGHDPNGLVYYKGVYYFFYQFYDDTKWGLYALGPCEWRRFDFIGGEQPIAFYPMLMGLCFRTG